MLNVLPLILLVAAAALAADVVGSLAGPLGLFVGLGLAGFGVLVGTSEREGSFRPLLLALGVVVLAGGVVMLGLWPHGRVNRLLALAALLAGADLSFRAFGRVRRELYPAAATSLVAGIFFLVLEYSPPAWMFWRNASIALSEVAGQLVDRPLRLGPSYSGFNTSVLPAIAVVVVFVLTQRPRWHRPALALLYLGAMAWAYMFTMTCLPSYDAAAHLPEVSAVWGSGAATALLPLLTRHVPWNMPLVLLVLQLPALWIVGDGVKVRGLCALPVGARERLWTCAGAAVLLAGVAAFVVRSPEVAQTGVRIVLREKGYLSWSSPDFKSFGDRSAGMLGRLPVFLGQLGFQVTRSAVMDDNALADARVVVIVNPYEKLPDDQHTALWNFVRRGGSLMVVGDHTWLNDKDEDTLNHLLVPSGIRFRFDSATYQTGGWLYGYDFAADGVTHRMGRDRNQPGIGIGASLALTGSAVPLLFGTHGYADEGIRSRRGNLGFMGDSRYVPGEQLGDVVLAAEQHVGDGRVVVVGDTSGFFNLLMMGSHEMIARLFGKLSAPPVRRHHGVRLAAGLVLILVVLVVAAVRMPRSILPVAVAALVVGAGAQWYAVRESTAVSLVPRGRIACVDGSHVGKFSRESWRADGLAGLYLNLMRNHVQPLRMDTLVAEHLLAARMLFIIAPTRAYAPREVDLVERFIRRGGYVVVCAGADSADAAAPLLKRFGLAVRNRPLGPFMAHCAAAGTMVRFHVGYAVEHHGDGDARVLAWYAPGDAALMMEWLTPKAPSTGRGGLLLIGDGHFLTNKNLEPDKTPPIMENVNFMKWLVRHVGTLDHTGDQP